MTKILVMGAGYVGLAHALLFTRNPDHEVTLADVNPEKVAQLQAYQSPVVDKEVIAALVARPNNLKAILVSQVDFASFDIIFLCLPTNYQTETSSLDTGIIDQVLAEIIAVIGGTIPVVIKSTLPIGYTQKQITVHACPNVMFSPEFLREGQALHDNLYPSRLILGSYLDRGVLQPIIDLYLSVVDKKDIPILLMSPTEAESVKLFANTYLAMRVAFFNELDSFSEIHDLDSRSLIEGIGLDPRIGNFYNNPSFGYGGYCLPKDSKQLHAHFAGIEADLMSAIVTSNSSRKQFILDRVLETGAQTIGIYRLAMKSSSDNSRESAIWDIMAGLRQAGCHLLVYEPSLERQDLGDNITWMADLTDFKQNSDLILANRWSSQLLDVANKVYSRDVFQQD